MIIEYEFGQVVGRSLDDYVFVGYRHDSMSGFPWNCESHAVISDGKRFDTIEGAGYLSGVWRSASGTVYVANGNDCEMVVLSGPDVHGVSRDLVYAVGADGLLARWDGSRWVRVESPTDSPYSGLFVQSADEMWACTSDGKLLEGSIHGWGHVLDHEEALSDIACWRASVWVAAPFEGLLRLDGKELVVVKDNIQGHHLHASERALLIACDDLIAATLDGKAYKATFLKDFGAMFKGRPPAWAPGVAFEDSGGA